MSRSQPCPPRLADKIFRWYCSNAMIEDLHGDVEEIFHENLSRMSAGQAKWHYWRQVFSLMFSYAVRKRKAGASFHPYSSHNYIDMFQNYLTIAVRSLSKHKFFTSLNVVGLSIGMSLCLLLVAMIAYVARYDNFHVNKDRIFRVTTATDNLQRNDEYASCPVPLYDKLAHEYSGIESIVRINRSFAADAIWNARQLPLKGYFADPGFLEMFTFPFSKGNPSTALSQVKGMVITEKAARKMFGSEDAIGKVITMGEFGDFSITGILKDHPVNSHMTFEVIAPYEALLAYQKTNHIDEPLPWENFRRNYIYLTLPEGGKPEAVNDFLETISGKAYASSTNFKAAFELQPLSGIVPGPELYDQIGPDWGYIGLTVFGVMTLLILLPACFNYASISMSRAIKRSKEIALRKVVGGQRNQIFTQFIMETVIVTLLALGGAWFLFVLIRGEFISMMANGASLELPADWITILCFIVFAVIVGFLSGVVPAIYFSGLNPVQAFKKNAPLKALSGISFRKVLIATQFTLSLGFIMAVVIVMNQYRQSLNYDFGFAQENILDVELKTVKPEIFRNEFAKLSTVQQLSMSSNILGTSTAGSEWVQEAGLEDSIEVQQMFVDENFIPNMKLQLIVGNNFPMDAHPEKSIIVNEEFLKAYKIAGPADALNKTFVIKGIDGEFRVAGVLKNFHYASLQAPIRSFFFRYDPARFVYANLTVKANDMEVAISEMDAVWQSFNTGDVFTHAFMTEEIADAYVAFYAMIKICGFMGILAISISCLGLLGVVVYTVEIRTKEVGVRKVMGATDWDVMVMLSKDFIRLMIIAAIIATPLTWLFFEKVFLRVQSYYSFGVGFVDVLISLLIMFFLGGLTVLSQTVRAARSNPVDTLRYE